MDGWRWAARAAASGLFLLATAAHSGPSPKTELAEVVARYIAWRGGEAFRNETDDYYESADLKLFGVAGKLETWHTPDHWRTELHAPGMSAVSVVTAHGSWSTTINGQLVETPEAYLYAKREPQSAEAMEGKAGDTVALLGQEQLDGRAWQVVRVSYGDADTYDSFIDPATGELGAARVTEKGQQTFEHFGDWRWVKGAREPFMSREVSPAGDEKVGTVTRLDVDVAIDPALFARPKPGQQLVYAGGRSATDWIPFTGLDEGRIFVPLTVNGRAVTAILDSGAGTALLDSAFAASAALKPVGAVPLSGENAVGAGALIAGVEIGLDGATLKGMTVTTTDLRSLGVVQPVLMGEDIFRGAVVDIDFPGQRLALRDPASFRPPAGAIAVTLIHDGADELVPVSVEGGAPATFILDTGFPARAAHRAASGQGAEPAGRQAVGRHLGRRHRRLGAGPDRQPGTPQPRRRQLLQRAGDVLGRLAQRHLYRPGPGAAGHRPSQPLPGDRRLAGGTPLSDPGAGRGERAVPPRSPWRGLGVGRPGVAHHRRAVRQPRRARGPESRRDDRHGERPARRPRQQCRELAGWNAGDAGVARAAPHDDPDARRLLLTPALKPSGHSCVCHAREGA